MQTDCIVILPLRHKDTRVREEAFYCLPCVCIEPLQIGAITYNRLTAIELLSCF